MKYIFLTQVYPPDSASVGQHFEDAAVRMAEKGHQVIVYTANRDYDDPSIKYDDSSRHPEVRVVRLPLSSFGKKTIAHRVTGQLSYLIQVFFRILFKGGIDGILLTTIPATTGIMFLFLRIFRKVPILYWVMDLNPDQAIIQGIVSETSMSARFLSYCNSKLYKHADSIVVMDRFMGERILSKGHLSGGEGQKVHVVAPWPMESHLYDVPRDENKFTDSHMLQWKRVYMYSGNHSLVHPLDTVLESIKDFKSRDDLAFLFVGGGRGKESVEAFLDDTGQSNVLSLPYQPIENLSHSLSAADVHFVVMGNPMVGIVHPCKIYGAMAIGKPVVFVGPHESHLGELVEQHGFGWVIEHGDIEGLKELINKLNNMPLEELEQIGLKGKQVLRERYSADLLANEFCSILENLG